MGTTNRLIQKYKNDARVSKLSRENHKKSVITKIIAIDEIFQSVFRKKHFELHDILIIKM